MAKLWARYTSVLGSVTLAHQVSPSACIAMWLWPLPRSSWLRASSINPFGAVYFTMTLMMATSTTPPIHWPSMNFHPSRTRRIRPSSSTRFVEAIMKASEEASAAPFLKSVRMMAAEA